MHDTAARLPTMLSSFRSTIKLRVSAHVNPTTSGLTTHNVTLPAVCRLIDTVAGLRLKLIRSLASSPKSSVQILLGSGDLGIELWDRLALTLKSHSQP